MHDVGKEIDPHDHVRAGLEVLEGLITARTAFFIEHRMLALELRAGTLGHKMTQRLRASEDFDDLMLLRDLDTAGRVRGGRVCEELNRASLRFIGNLDERCLHNPLTPTTALDGDCGKWQFHKCWANCSLALTRNQEFP